MKINNISQYARNKKYIVFRLVDGEAWFYDAWDDINRAMAQAVEVDGQVIPTSEVAA